MFLPDRFKKTTTELADGTVIVLDLEDEDLPEKKVETVIEIRPTFPEEVRTEDENEAESEQPSSSEPADQEPEEQDDQQEKLAEEVGPKPQKQISRAERRRRIKEEIMRLAGGQEKGYYQRRLW